MQLRDYQKQDIENIRNAFRKTKRVFYCLPTGAGKTVIFTEITRLLTLKGRTCWIVVPRDILKKQTSEKLLEIGINHGIIAPGNSERQIFGVHVVSKDTWIRRKEKIKNKPDFIIVDEGHLATERYTEMINEYPDAFFLFVSATPERLDGKGLTYLSDTVVYGPSMKHLIEAGYLSPMRYYCPPIKGIDQLKKRGQEFDADELEAFLNEKKIYGKAIEHYKKLSSGKTAIVFCRSVDAAKQTAERFSSSGFLFESIDGSMSWKKRKTLLDAVSNGQLNGLTSCDLVTYGLDVPRVETIVMLRPTLSRALYYQMIGRGLRVYENKKHCTVLDHVGNARRHCTNGLPWEPVNWNYNGRKKKTKISGPVSIKFCPYIEFMPCVKASCVNCEYNKTGKPIKDFEEVDGELVETVSNLKYKERPFEEQQYFSDRINTNKKNVILDSGEIDVSKLEKLLETAKEIGNSPMWIYHLVLDNWDGIPVDEKVVHIGLLEEIRKIKNYKTGWVHYQEKNLKNV
jgi:DNA repair protein RadD